MEAGGTGAKVRLDRWLWAARLFKTRALAAQAISGGRVDVNGLHAKPAKLLQPGDEVRVRKGPLHYVLRVLALAEHRGPAAAAAALYQEDAEAQRARERLAWQLKTAPSLRYGGKGRPTKKDRRQIEKWRGE